MKFCLGLLLLLGIIVSCTDGNNTEIIEIDEIIPEAKGKYDYSDSIAVEEEREDEFILELERSLNAEVELIDLKEMGITDHWRYMPDRLDSDSSLTKTVMIDSSVIQFKVWEFGDSIRTVNAFYNWLDCFGDDCSSISIGDSVNVSKNSFLLLQSNKQIQFIQSSDNLNIDRWKTFFNQGKKNTPWNYVIKQKPRGIIIWEKPED